MGGMVTIAARYKSGETVAFKTSTNFFHYNMNSPYLMDEEHFKEQLLKHDFLRDDYLPENDASIYDNRKGVIAPYDYGIIFIDYMNGRLLSCNDYSPMVHANSAKLLDDYAQFVKQNYVLKVQDFKGNTKEVIDIREKRFMDYQDIHFVHTALKNNAIIKIKGKKVEHNGTIESVLEAIYGVELQGKTVEDKLAEIKKHGQEEARINNEKYGNPYRSTLEDYADITFEYPNFKLVECDSDNEHNIIYEYIKNEEIQLTEYEHSVWKKFIERKLKQYHAQLDREVDE